MTNRILILDQGSDEFDTATLLRDQNLHEYDVLFWFPNTVRREVERLSISQLIDSDLYRAIADQTLRVSEWVEAGGTLICVVGRAAQMRGAPVGSPPIDFPSNAFVPFGDIEVTWSAGNNVEACGPE